MHLSFVARSSLNVGHNLLLRQRRDFYTKEVACLMTTTCGHGREALISPRNAVVRRRKPSRHVPSMCRWPNSAVKELSRQCILTRLYYPGRCRPESRSHRKLMSENHDDGNYGSGGSDHVPRSVDSDACCGWPWCSGDHSEYEVVG